MPELRGVGVLQKDDRLARQKAASPDVDGTWQLEDAGSKNIVHRGVLALTVTLMGMGGVAVALTPARAVPMTIVLVPVLMAAILGRRRDVLVTSVLALAMASLIATHDGLWGTPDAPFRLALIVFVSTGAGLLAAIRDRQADQLRTTALRLRTVVDGVGVGLAVLSLDRTFELVSTELTTMLGCRGDELRGQPFDSVVVVDDGSTSEMFEWSMTAPGEPFRAVAQFSNGAAVPVRCTVSPFAERGLNIGSLVVISDYREELRSQQERENERATAEHRQRLELVGQLAGGLAHDFNNLLAAAQMAVELSVDSIDDAETQEMLGVAGTSIRKAGSVTRQLLTLSRRDQASPELLELNDMLATMEPLLKTSVGPTITTVIDVDDATPAVMMDATQFEQVLLNLSTNARDAMPDRGIFTVRVGPHNSGTSVRIDVVDTGAGMDPATASKAFEPFYTTKTRRAGTGLGLAMVEQIVVGAGGTVGLASEVGSGTTVTITLPAFDDRPSNRVESLIPPREYRADGGQGTVLVVDDQVDLAQLTGTLLRRAGYSVLVATSAHQALELASTPPTIDLVLSDVVMPEMDGLELAECLRTHHPETPVLFMSGYTADVFGPNGPASGTHFLTKPFNAEELLEAVAERIRERTTPQHAG